MQCVNPLPLQSSTGGDFTVPCGKCIGCRAAKSKEWTQRLLNEQQYWPTESFVTLTYDDDHYPEDGSLHKEHIQGFFKSLRKKLDPYKIKYFACGEYGENTLRCHWHSIIFGVDERFDKLIYESWPYGDRISIDPVEPGAIAYVTGYVRKKIADNYGRYRKLGLALPFQLQSQGLGLRWAIDNKDTLEKNGLTREGKNISIPRYYIRKLNLNGDVMYRELSETYDERDREFIDRGMSYPEIVDELNRQRAQHKKNLKGRMSLKSPGDL